MSYFDHINPDQACYNDTGTHHDRHLTNTEILWLGVGLWRTMSWVKENGRRLTPQEKAEYDLAVERWKAYLTWEAEHPGARELREALVARQQQEEFWANVEADKQWRARYVWRPFSLLGAIMWVSNFIPHREHIFIPVGFVLWWATWRFCRKVKRIWYKVREARLRQEAEARLQPGDHLTIPWNPGP